MALTPEEVHELSLISSRKGAGIPIDADEAAELAHLEAQSEIEQRRQRLARSFRTRSADLSQFVSAPHRELVRLPVIPSGRTDRLVASRHVGAPDGSPNGVRYVAALVEGVVRREYALAESSPVGWIDATLWQKLQDGITQSAREEAYISPESDAASFYAVFGFSLARPGSHLRFDSFLRELAGGSPAAMLPIFAAWHRSIGKSGHMYADRHATVLYEACAGRSPSVDLFATEPWEPKAKSTASGATAKET